MKRNRRRLTALLTFLLLAGFVGGAGFWLQAQQRQYALNRQLIAALVTFDDKQAIALVNAGADPNTHYRPTSVPSLHELVKQLLHWSSQTANDPTAFAIACGASWSELDPLFSEQNHPDAPQLVQTMLRHGANANLPCWFGWTPLKLAVYYDGPKTVNVLLQYGANANAKDEYGMTALHWAAGSRVDKAIINQLLVHGADPNLADTSGATPLMLAKQINRPDIVALLKQAGARKPGMRP